MEGKGGPGGKPRPVADCRSSATGEMMERPHPGQMRSGFRYTGRTYLPRGTVQAGKNPILYDRFRDAFLSGLTTNLLSFLFPSLNAFSLSDFSGSFKMIAERGGGITDRAHLMTAGTDSWFSGPPITSPPRLVDWGGASMRGSNQYSLRHDGVRGACPGGRKSLVC